MMEKSKRTTGLHFVITTPIRAVDERDRRLIKSHATRARKTPARVPHIRSWIAPGREVEPPKVVDHKGTRGIPQRAGSDFSGLQLPPGIEPCMIQELIKLIDYGKITRYPYEICVDVPPVERGWFPYMLSDACCLHSLMFSLRAWEDSASQLKLNHLASFHYAQTLQLLQTRLYESDQTCAISDATIMVVTLLATVAELMNERATVENHIRGLEKMVRLRGGVRALTTHTNMHVKVCRADLSFAILSGRPPLFFDEGMSWDCFIANPDYSQCSHLASLHDLLKATLHTRLENVFKDVHALSCISNLAFQTTCKLSPDLYNEMMISILYRLTNLSFDTDDSQEAIRLGLLCFCSSVYVQRQFMEQSQDNLLKSFTRALYRLRKTQHNNLPAPISFWMLMLLDVIAPSEHHFIPIWHGIWLAEVIDLINFDSWLQAKETLQQIAWISFAHDRLGGQAFDIAKKVVVRP